MQIECWKNLKGIGMNQNKENILYKKNEMV